MTVTYNATVKTNRLSNVVDAIASKTYASGTGTALAGSLVIGTSALSGATGVLATITLNATPATVSGNVLTISGVPLSATASASGTAALAEIRNNAGTTIVSGLTVGTSGADIIINTTAITSGQTVQLNSGTITHS